MTDFEIFFKKNASEIIHSLIVKDWKRFVNVVTPFFSEQIKSKGIKPISQYTPQEIDELLQGISPTHEAILSYCAHAIMQIKVARLS